MDTVYTFEVDSKTPAGTVTTFIAAFACAVAPATVRNRGRIGSAPAAGEARNWLITVRGPRATFVAGEWIAEVNAAEAEAVKLGRILNAPVSGLAAWVEEDDGEVVAGSVC